METRMAENSNNCCLIDKYIKLFITEDNFQKIIGTVKE
jgi:hypothetical protein